MKIPKKIQESVINQGFYKTNNINGLFALVFDIFIISFSISIVNYYSYWIFPIAVIIVGSKIRAIATLLHDGVHLCLMKDRKINSILSYVCGFLIFQDPKIYKKSHVKNHHGNFSNILKDPDYLFFVKLGFYDNEGNPLPKKLKIADFIRYIVFLINDRLYMKNYSQYFYLKLFFFWIILLLFIYLNFDVKLLTTSCLILLVSNLITHPIIGFLIELGEHYPLMEPNSRNILNSSRNRYGNKLESLFFEMHNENFHLTHHLFPRVPFWKQEKLTNHLRKEWSDFRKADSIWGGIITSKLKSKSTVLSTLK